MKIAIIGLANSGKTTVFNALTGGSAETTAYSSGQLTPNLATVKVPDPRLDTLALMFKPKKVTPADVQYIDIGGLSSSARESGGCRQQCLTISAAPMRSSMSFAHSRTKPCRIQTAASIHCETSRQWIWNSHSLI